MMNYYQKFYNFLKPAVQEIEDSLLELMGIEFDYLGPIQDILDSADAFPQREIWDALHPLIAAIGDWHDKVTATHMDKTESLLEFKKMLIFRMNKSIQDLERISKQNVKPLFSKINAFLRKEGML